MITKDCGCIVKRPDEPAYTEHQAHVEWSGDKADDMVVECERHTAEWQDRFAQALLQYGIERKVGKA